MGAEEEDVRRITIDMVDAICANDAGGSSEAKRCSVKVMLSSFMSRI